MSEERVKVDFIAGLGHSGTTILGMALGCRDNSWFISEKKAFDKTYKDPCLCGKKPTRCEYWSHVDSNNFHAMLRRAQELKGPQVERLVDSSKNIDSLSDRLKNRYTEVTVWHMVRSPWTHFKKRGWHRLYQWVRDHALIFLLTWWRGGNYRFLRYKDLNRFKEREQAIRDETYHFFNGNLPAAKNFEEIKIRDE